MPQLWFFMSIAFSFIAWGIVTARYVWPEIRLRPRAEALRPLLILHSFRFIGLAFLAPGVVSPDLPPAFAHSAGYGDIIAAIRACADIAPWWGLALSSHGFPVFGVQPISSTLSTRQIAPGSCRGSWERPTSFQPSSCPCC
jgi:hypothetical protein